MKLRFLFGIFLVAAVVDSGADDLHPELSKILQLINEVPAASNLVGQEFELDLTVKHATEKFLVFSDAYVAAEGATRYQIAKWLFHPGLTAQAGIRPGNLCRVRFSVKEVVTGSPYDDMPHFVAEVISISVNSIYEVFESAYRRAHEAKNTEAFVSLVEFAPDTPAWMREQAIETFESDTKLKVIEISFEPLDDVEFSFVYEGVVYVPTLEPVVAMAIRFDEAGQGDAMITGTTYLLGEKEGSMRIVAAKPKG